MLKKIVRHGFVFWEAKPNAGPPKGDKPGLFARLHNIEQMEANALLSLPATPAAAAAPSPAHERRSAKPDSADPAAWGELVQFSDAAGAGPSLAGAEHIAQIQASAMQAFGVTREAFFSDNAKRPTVWARLASLVLCHQFTRCNQKQIAQAHQRNDAVVCRALYRFEGMRRKYPAFDAGVSAILATQTATRMAA
jgi:hypothetical protein